MKKRVTVEWNEFKKSYEEGKISVSVDKSTAMLLMDKKNKYVHEMFKARRQAHSLWLNIALLFMGIGLISAIAWFFMDTINGWIPIVSIALSFLLSASVRTSASKFILEESLENESYYNMLKEEQDSKGAIILQVMNNEK